MVVTKSAQFVEVCATSEFGQIMVWLLQFSLQVGEILHDGSAVSDVTLPHAFLFDFILLALQMRDWVFIEFGRDIFDDLSQMSVAFRGHSELGICFDEVNQTLIDLIVWVDRDIDTFKILLDFFNLIRVNVQIHSKT